MGVKRSIKETLIPTVLFSMIAFTSKIIFNAPSVIQTLVLVLICTVLIWAFNKVNLLLSVIGSLLSFITLVLGSLLLVCPLFNNLGIQIPKETDGANWIFLNLAEYIVPLLVLFFLNLKKLPMVKVINK